MSDDFTAADGTAWNTTKWDTGSAGTRFTTLSNQGAADLTGLGAWAARLAQAQTPTFADGDVTGTVLYTSGDGDVQAELRAPKGTSTGGSRYLVQIARNGLFIYKKISGKSAYLAGTTAKAATAGTRYGFRFATRGSTVMARLWNAGTTEPTTWDVSVTDTSITSAGYARVMFENGNQNTAFRLDDIQVTVPTSTTTSPTASPSPTATSSPSPSPSPTATSTASPTPSPTATTTTSPATSTGNPWSGAGVQSSYTPPSGAVQVAVGQLSQSLIDAYPSGTVFALAPGIHRLTAAITPKSGMQFHGYPGARVSGAKLLTSWTASGAYWYIGGQTQRLPVSSAGGYQLCTNDAPLCARGEDVFMDDRALTPVGSQSQLGPGKYWFDYSNSRIWIADNPSGRTVETSVAAQAFTGGSGNTFRNLVIEKFGNAAQTGALQLNTSNVIECTVRLNHGTGIFAGGGQLVHDLISENGQMGIGSGGSGQTVQNNEIAYNNRAHFNPYWEAGGTKWARATNLTVQNNWSHDNYGPGLWTDIDNYNVLYDGNLVENNAMVGIFHEISYDAVIRNNTVRGNGYAPGLPNYYNGQVGINVTDSPNVQVYGNTISGNKGGGVLGLEDTRAQYSGSRGPWQLKNLAVHNNTVTLSGTGSGGSGSGMEVYSGVASRSAYYTSYNNVFSNNTYRVPSGTSGGSWFIGENGWLNWTQWRSTGQDAGSAIGTY